MTDYESIKFDLRKNRHELRQNAMKLLMLHIWQDWNEHGKEDSTYKTWGDAITNINKILDQKTRDICHLKTEADAEDLIKDMIYVYDILGKDRWIINRFYYPYMECITGNDGDLQYYYKCSECDTIMVVDHSSPECVKPLLCPLCCEIENSPWRFITVEDDEYDSVNKWMEKDAYYWSHPWYQKLISIKVKLLYFWYKITGRYKKDVVH